MHSILVTEPTTKAVEAPRHSRCPAATAFWAWACEPVAATAAAKAMPIRLRMVVALLFGVPSP